MSEPQSVAPNSLKVQPDHLPEEWRTSEYRLGYTDALDAARDAVLAVAMIGRGAASPPSGWVPTTDALAAIDALEKP